MDPPLHREVCVVSRVINKVIRVAKEDYSSITTTADVVNHLAHLIILGLANLY